MSLYSSFAATRGGERMLASARLRYRILTVLHEALRDSGLTKAELAKRLKVRRSAVGNVFRGDGNVRINTVAEYLFAMDRELVLTTVERGAPRVMKVSPGGSTVAVSEIVSPGRYKPATSSAYQDANSAVKVA